MLEKTPLRQGLPPSVLPDISPTRREIGKERYQCSFHRR